MNRREIEMFYHGVSAFNRGTILEAHKTWEAIWKQESPEDKEWIKGFIQLSGGLLKIKANQLRSAVYLLKKARERLGTSPIASNLVRIDTVVMRIEELLNIIENDTLIKKDRAEYLHKVKKMRIDIPIENKI